MADLFKAFYDANANPVSRYTAPSRSGSVSSVSSKNNATARKNNAIASEKEYDLLQKQRLQSVTDAEAVAKARDAQAKADKSSLEAREKKREQEKKAAVDAINSIIYMYNRGVTDEDRPRVRELLRIIDRGAPGVISSLTDSGVSALSNKIISSVESGDISSKETLSAINLLFKSRVEEGARLLEQKDGIKRSAKIKGLEVYAGEDGIKGTDDDVAVPILEMTQTHDENGEELSSPKVTTAPMTTLRTDDPDDALAMLPVSAMKSGIIQYAKNLGAIHGAAISDENLMKDISLYQKKSMADKIANGEIELNKDDNGNHFYMEQTLQGDVKKVYIDESEVRSKKLSKQLGKMIETQNERFKGANDNLTAIRGEHKEVQLKIASLEKKREAVLLKRKQASELNVGKEVSGQDAELDALNSEIEHYKGILDYKQSSLIEAERSVSETNAKINHYMYLNEYASINQNQVGGIKSIPELGRKAYFGNLDPKVMGHIPLLAQNAIIENAIKNGIPQEQLMSALGAVVRVGLEKEIDDSVIVRLAERTGLSQDLIGQMVNLSNESVTAERERERETQKGEERKTALENAKSQFGVQIGNGQEGFPPILNKDPKEDGADKSGAIGVKLSSDKDGNVSIGTSSKESDFGKDTLDNISLKDIDKEGSPYGVSLSAPEESRPTFGKSNMPPLTESEEELPPQSGMALSASN